MLTAPSSTSPSPGRIRFERPRADEASDIREIVRGILSLQARYASMDNGRLERGTHAKGVCARATFEVFDVAKLVTDPRLANRLRRGIFAHPGSYPAIVRFANGASRIQADRKADVRAMSFSIDVPSGLVGSAMSRLDFTLQDATTFPINDAHAFATLMRVDKAAVGSRWGQAKAFWSLPVGDVLSLMQMAALAFSQTHRRLRAYQSLRYWSTVPFRHGPDEAIKYSATPSPTNPAGAIGSGRECLRDELVRHLTEDSEMSSWDFGLQLLDAGRLTRWGRTRDISYWIENASVEWDEKQAPFFTVGRLTLQRGSLLSDEEASAMYIDVTQYAAPGCEPLGSINRARWMAESASRQARLTGVSEVPAETPLKPSVKSRLLRWAVIVALLLFAADTSFNVWYNWGASSYLAPVEQSGEVAYISSGWDNTARDLYYYTPQGASLHGIRYSWFVNLERPTSRTRIADPEHMRQLRFIVDPLPSRANPDQLPVGFARRYDNQVQDFVVDITCSACHTGQLNYTQPNGKRYELRIDGGSSLGAVSDMQRGGFPMELAMSLTSTMLHPLKFRRFAHRVLGANARLSTEWELWNDLRRTGGTLLAAGMGSAAPWRYPTQEGYGRTDALARIANTVFGDHIDKVNYRDGNAPVNYPYVWNIWKFNWVQYNASVSQPMARNVGEVMGTGASYQIVDKYGRPVPPTERYRTSIAFDNLQRIESTLQSLQPPAWRNDILPPVDTALASKGKALFDTHCYGCHGPHPLDDVSTKIWSPTRNAGDALWDITPKPLSVIGTDPNTALNFAKNRVDLTRSGLEADDVGEMLRRVYTRQLIRQEQMIGQLEGRIQDAARANKPNPDLARQLDSVKKDLTGTQQMIDSLDEVDLRSVSIGEGLTIFGTMIRNRFFEDRHFSAQARACFEGFDTLDVPETFAGYKPRPLKGVWATPPFLHNGSVPTIYALLSPLDKRPSRFYVGNREFDPKNIGYVTTPPSSGGGFWYDTTLSGNHNTGHLFIAKRDQPRETYPTGVIGPMLTDEERYAIIEYLKVGPDEIPTPLDRKAPDCFTLLNGGGSAPSTTATY